MRNLALGKARASIERLVAEGAAGAIFGGLLLAGVAVADCGSDAAAGGDQAEAKKVRVVVMADTHVIGPEYLCCSESPGIDNASIVKTVDRLTALRATVNAIGPEAVFILGDVVHNAHTSRELDHYLQNETGFSLAAELLRGFDMPVYPVWGNHDYGVDCDGGEATYPRELTHGIFQEVLGAPPYQAVELGGFKFLLTNGQLGATWDADSPYCDTSLASYGEEQLGWIAAQLAEGKPTVVMSHYMRLLHFDQEEGEYASLPALLDGHENVRAFLAGHTHRWLDLTALNAGVMHQVLAATRYDEDNFWLLELDPSRGTFEVLDRDKQIPSGSCAATWSYEGTPAPVAGAPETGDCVVGVEE
jgi:predicted phosphodiesterase